jgi:FAD/FMN-containing dehydrogenase
VDDLDDEMVKICVSGAEALESRFTMVQIRGLGGEMSRVPADATAFSHRDKAFMVQAIAAWKGEDPEGQHDRWVEEFLTAMSPHAEGVYVNFLATDGKERAREAYSDSTWRRLEEVKRRYDPENLFRPTVNIQP